MTSCTEHDDARSEIVEEDPSRPISPTSSAQEDHRPDEATDTAKDHEKHMAQDARDIGTDDGERYMPQSALAAAVVPTPGDKVVNVDETRQGSASRAKPPTPLSASVLENGPAADISNDDPDLLDALKEEIKRVLAGHNDEEGSRPRSWRESTLDEPSSGFGADSQSGRDVEEDHRLDRVDECGITESPTIWAR